MATAGSIVIDLLMKTGSFETDTQRAERSMKRMKGTAQDAATGIGLAFAAVGTAVAGGATAAIAAVSDWTREVAQLSTEVDRWSRLSGADAITFQKWAAGAATVGIQQDKLADILKDTQDKVGDFLQTGGGPMADFFEKIAPKVGLTAEQFRKLSGPQALGAYVEALQKAGLSQNEMTFYMEAIASDSTLLLPLLLDNAKGMRDWGDQAQKFGAIIGDETSAALKEFREQANRVELMARGMKIELAEGLTPAPFARSLLVSPVAQRRCRAKRPASRFRSRTREAPGWMCSPRTSSSTESSGLSPSLPATLHVGDP